MLPRRTLARSALGAALLAAAACPAVADSDVEAALLAANKAFHAAIAARDLGALEALSVRDAEAGRVHPRDRAPALGWEAVRAAWAEMFSRHAELRVAMPEPRATVLAGGRAGIVSGVLRVAGRSAEDGAAIGFEALVTNVFEAREPGRWLLVHHHMTKQPG